ncbi:MAG: MMPL family transporter [Pseudomonadota bacterium]
MENHLVGILTSDNTLLLQRYVTWLKDWHWFVLVVLCLCILGLGLGISNLSISDDFRVYFKKDNPRIITLDALEDAFNTNDTIFFLLVPKNKDIFDAPNLSILSELTEEGWLLPYATRVNSLANFQHSYSEGDDIFVSPMVDSESLTDEESEEIRRIALAEPQLRDNVVAENAEVTGVAVSISIPSENNETASREAVDAARELQRKYQEAYPEINFLLAGSLTTNIILAEAVSQDVLNLVTLSFGIISLGLWVLLRSLAGMVVTVLVIGASTLATLGFFGHLGYTVTPVAAFAPSIIMTIAVADSVHILANFFFFFRSGDTREHALCESLRINIQPIFFTSVTTIIGVLTLNFSESPPYQDLGNMVAVGVFLAFFFSLTLLPAILLMWPIKQTTTSTISSHPMERLGQWVVGNQRPLLWVMGGIILLVASFIPRNQLSEMWHEYFDDTFEYRQAIDLVDSKLSGIDGLVYRLDTGSKDGIYDPDYLAEVEAFAQWLRSQPEVVHVNSLTDTLKRLNQNMHADDPSWYRIPDRRDLAAQYLLIYELQLPPGLGTDTAINLDRSATRLGVTLRKTDSSHLIEVEERTAQWLAENTTTFLLPEASGLDLVFAHLNNNNIRSLLGGTVLALTLISVVLVLMFRSIKLGLTSLVPNLGPAALAYGLWALYDGRINVALSVVIAISLGIVVDDTVHFLSKYLRARREKNLSPEQGIIYAFRTVGVALTITTFVLVVGFSILGFSHFNPTKQTGTLLAITLAGALIIDFFFLPPLLMKVDKQTSVNASDSSTHLGESTDKPPNR